MHCLALGHNSTQVNKSSTMVPGGWCLGISVFSTTTGCCLSLMQPTLQGLGLSRSKPSVTGHAKETYMQHKARAMPFLFHGCRGPRLCCGHWAEFVPGMLVASGCAFSAAPHQCSFFLGQLEHKVVLTSCYFFPLHL